MAILQPLHSISVCVCVCLFRPHQAACGILVPQPGIEPVHRALGARILNHWTAWEVPLCIFRFMQRQGNGSPLLGVEKLLRGSLCYHVGTDT